MINYHLIKRGQPSVVGGGEKKFYAEISMGRKVNLDQLSKRISEISPLSLLVIKSSLLAFLSIVPEYLVEGSSVDLGDFVSMNVTLKSPGVENEDDFTTELIKGNCVHFRPSVKFSNLMKNVKYEREEE